MQIDKQNQIPKEKVPFKKRFLSLLTDLLYVGIAIGIALLIQRFIGRPFIVNGTSMDPTFKNYEYLLIDEITYDFKLPQRGEVIVFKAPPEPNKYYIKRIVGLPGDTVTITGSVITISNSTNPKGFVLPEGYITHTENDSGTYVVPKDEYFVMGDNRTGSYDSRSWGMLPKANIDGRVFMRLLPVQRLGIFPGEEIYGK